MTRFDLETGKDFFTTEATLTKEMTWSEETQAGVVNEQLVLTDGRLLCQASLAGALCGFLAGLKF